MLVRADTSGYSHTFVVHIWSLRECGLNVRLSVDAANYEAIRRAIMKLAADALTWQ